MHLRSLTLCLTLGLPLVARAWCPDPSQTLIQEFKQSNFVFVGKVVASAAVDRGADGIGGINYKIMVIERLRGNPTNAITVFSESSSGRFPMSIGKSYLLFVTPQAVEAFPSPVFTVDNCGHSGSLPQSSKVLHDVRRLAEKPAV